MKIIGFLLLYLMSSSLIGQNNFNGLWLESKFYIEKGYDGPMEFDKNHPDLFNANWTVYLLEINDSTAQLKALGQAPISLSIIHQGDSLLLSCDRFTLKATFDEANNLEVRCQQRAGQIEKMIFKTIQKPKLDLGLKNIGHLLTQNSWNLQLYKDAAPAYFMYDDGHDFLMRFKGKTSYNFNKNGFYTLLQDNDSLHYLSFQNWAIDSFAGLYFLIEGSPGKINNQNYYFTNFDGHTLSSQHLGLLEMLHIDGAKTETYSIDWVAEPFDSANVRDSILGRWTQPLNFDNISIENPRMEFDFLADSVVLITIKSSSADNFEQWTYRQQGKWYLGQENKVIWLDFASQKHTSPIRFDFENNQWQLSIFKDPGFELFLEIIEKAESEFYESFGSKLIHIENWREKPIFQRFTLYKIN